MGWEMGGGILTCILTLILRRTTVDDIYRQRRQKGPIPRGAGETPGAPVHVYWFVRVCQSVV